MPDETGATCKSTPGAGSPPSPSPGRGGATRWKKGQSGNPRGRRPGPISQVLKDLRALAAEKAIPKLAELVEEGDVDACKVVLAYGIPRQKPVQVPERIALPDTDNLTEKALAAIALMAAGKISSETASDVVSMAATVARIDEVTQLREEVDRLSALLDARRSL